MRKLMVLLFSVVILVACSNNDNNNVNDVQNNDNEQVENNSNNDSEDANNGVSEDSNNSDITSINNDELEDLEEYEILAKELDLTKYQGVIESDNQGNRVILFETEDGNKEYKSIFVKKKNRLKIVHFDDEDDLLFNDIIE